MAVLTGKVGFIYGRSTSTAMVAEAMTSSAGNVYQVTAATHRILDPTTALTATISAGTAVDLTYMDRGYDYFNGKITLTAKDTPTITGAYLTLTTMVSIVSWSVSPNRNTAETTAMGEQWKSYTALDNGITVTVNRFFYDSDNWDQAKVGNAVIVKLFESTDAGFWAKGYIGNFNVTASVGQVTNEAFTIQCDGPFARFTA